MSTPLLRLVIAEDSAILRAGMVELVQARGCEVVAAVGDGTHLEAAVGDLAPDVAIIDVRMPPTFTDEGICSAIRLRSKFPRLGVLISTHHVESDLATELLGNGAGGIGYLLKERVAAVDEFVDALRRIAAGGTALDPELIAELIGARRHRRLLDSLTHRELEVLGLMAEGHSNRAVANTLVVGERAVEKFVTSIFQKLDLPPNDAENRRVRAVLTYLGESS